MHPAEPQKKNILSWVICSVLARPLPSFWPPLHWGSGSLSDGLLGDVHGARPVNPCQALRQALLLALRQHVCIETAVTPGSPSRGTPSLSLVRLVLNPKEDSWTERAVQFLCRTTIKHQIPFPATNWGYLSRKGAKIFNFPRGLFFTLYCEIILLKAKCEYY